MLDSNLLSLVRLTAPEKVVGAVATEKQRCVSERLEHQAAKLLDVVAAGATQPPHRPESRHSAGISLKKVDLLQALYRYLLRSNRSERDGNFPEGRGLCLLSAWYLPRPGSLQTRKE